jgi:hypothetical protein
MIGLGVDVNDVDTDDEEATEREKRRDEEEREEDSEARLRVAASGRNILWQRKTGRDGMKAGSPNIGKAIQILFSALPPTASSR